MYNYMSILSNRKNKSYSSKISLEFILLMFQLMCIPSNSSNIKTIDHMEFLVIILA